MYITELFRISSIELYQRTIVQCASGFWEQTLR